MGTASSDPSRGFDIGDGASVARHADDVAARRVAIGMWALIAVVLVVLVVVSGTIEGWVPDALRGLRDLFVAAQPAAPFSTALVALVVGSVALASHLHRRVSDNRAEWWRRSQYAIDLVSRDHDKIGRNTGMTILTHQLDDVSAANKDLKLLDNTVYALIQEVVSDPSRASTGVGPNRESDKNHRFARRLGAQIRAVLEEVRR